MSAVATHHPPNGEPLVAHAGASARLSPGEEPGAMPGRRPVTVSVSYASQDVTGVGSCWGGAPWQLRT